METDSKRRDLCVSILIPVYNERYFVEDILERVRVAPLPDGLRRELIVVDDGSTDGTCDVLSAVAVRHPDQIRLVFHEQNRGKGAAIRTAIEQASGDICLIQDADHEYDPADYPKLLAPILKGDADVVYGSRFAATDYRRVLFFWHAVGNRFLTTLSNMFTGLNLTDMETCYKVARTDILKSIPLRQDRFGMEPELTAKFAKRECRIYEVPVSYRGRTYDEGKKITWRDGLKALWVILHYWVVDDIYEQHYGHAILHQLAKTHRFNRWMADTVRPFIGNEVLEIGAGLGNLTSKLLPREHYTVSDIDTYHLNYLHNRFGDYANFAILEIDLEDAAHFEPIREAYDTIVCLNVLEHVPDHEAALANLYDALKPGGSAVILVPRGPWLFGTLDRALDHCRRYTRKELTEKCEAAGFEIAKLFSFNRAGLWPWFINGKILRRKTFAKLQLKIYDSTIWFWRTIDRLLPWAGLSLIVVARKPERSDP